jgi:hypothetical protein
MMSFTSALFGCASHVTPVVTDGKNVLGIVRFPEMWTSTQRTPASAGGDGTQVLSISGVFEVRHLASPSAAELLFGVRSVEGYRSDNHFAVAADGSFRVRAITADDWKRAEPLEVSGSLAVGEVDRDTLTGSTFPYTGASVSRVMRSADKTLVALLSITESARPDLGFVARGRYRGTVYVDLYKTTTGERFATAQAVYDGARGDIAFADAAWIDDRAFVVPLELSEQTCFIAIRPFDKR